MDYNKTTKDRLIELLKAAQSENVRLAKKADKDEQIAMTTMVNNATLRDELTGYKHDAVAIDAQQRERIEELNRVIAERGELGGEQQNEEYLEMKNEIERLKKAAHRDWIKSDRTDVKLHNKELECKELEKRIEKQSSTIESYQSEIEGNTELRMHLSAAILRLEVDVSRLRGGE